MTSAAAFVAETDHVHHRLTAAAAVAGWRSLAKPAANGGRDDRGAQSSLVAVWPFYTVVPSFDFWV